MTEPFVIARGLGKAFGSKLVLDDVSLEVDAGDVVGVLGKNGAGKTTLLELMLGFTSATAGKVEVFGEDSYRLSGSAKARVGFVPQQDELLDTMHGSEFLDLIGKFYPRWNSGLVERLARDWQVPLARSPNRMSVGQRQKLSILAALGHEPELIVLDEPVASLDPLARREFLKELIDIVSSGERTILFSTHIVSDLERVANRVWILKDGELVIDEPLDNLKESSVQIRQAAGSTVMAGLRIDPGMPLEEIFLELHK